MAKPLREMTSKEHVKRREGAPRASKQWPRKVVWTILSVTCWQVLEENKRVRSVRALAERVALAVCSWLQGQAPL